MNDTTIDTNAIIERLFETWPEGSHPNSWTSDTEKVARWRNRVHEAKHEAAVALRTLTAERDENKRLYMTSLRNVQTSVAHAADLNAQLENYQEKARALYKYLGDKNVDGIEAVITEFSLMAEQEGNR